jgi:hypothetical protein
MRRPLLARIACVVVVLLAACSPTRTPAPTSAVSSLGPTASGSPLATQRPSPTAGLAAALTLVASYNVSPDLMAAAGGRLYGVVASSSGSNPAVVRANADGTITRHPLADPLAGYFSALAVEGTSLYVGTTVVKRFTSAADELIRIDTSTLAVTARTALPGGVVGGIVADRGSVWVALPDRVLRLDSMSLAIRASYVFRGLVVPPGGSASVTSLALGRGGLWVTVGDANGTSLFRFDPVSLSTPARIAVPPPNYGVEVVADPESVWLTGIDWVRIIDPSGRLADPTSAPELQIAAAQGLGLVALLSDGQVTDAFVEVNARGEVVARTAVGDAGARLALDGRDVWLLQGLSVAHWTLAVPQP